MDCIFCKIATHEIPASVIYEDDHAIAFLDIEPRVPGHTVVIPKVHAETILDLPEKELEPFICAVRRATDRVRQGLHPDGFTLGINHGKASGQAVEHLHFHIMPRWHDDGGTSLHGVVSNTPSESVDEIGARIRAAVDETTASE